MAKGKKVLLWPLFFLTKRFTIAYIFVNQASSFFTQALVIEALVLIGLVILTEIRPHYEVTMRRIEVFNEVMTFLLLMNVSLFSEAAILCSPIAFIGERELFAISALGLLFGHITVNLLIIGLQAVVSLRVRLKWRIALRKLSKDRIAKRVMMKRGRMQRQR